MSPSAPERHAGGTGAAPAGRWSVELTVVGELDGHDDLVGVLDIQELAGLDSKQRALQVTNLPGFPRPALTTA